MLLLRQDTKTVAEDLHRRFISARRPSQLKIRKAPPQLVQGVFWEPGGAAIDHAMGALDQTAVDLVAPCRRGDIVESPQQAKADRDIGSRIVPDLLEGSIEEAFKADPGDHDSQDMRRPEEKRAWRRAADPANQDAAQLIDTAYGGARIVHSGREIGRAHV